MPAEAASAQHGSAASHVRHPASNISDTTNKAAPDCDPSGTNTNPPNARYDTNQWAWLNPKQRQLLSEMRDHCPSPGNRDALSESGGVLGAVPLSHFASALKILPKNTKSVKLVGEGAANAVFEIQIPNVSSQEGYFRSGFLLRIAKVSQLGKTTTFDYLEQQRYYHTVIKPLLGHHAVRQELVILRGTNLIEESNQILRSANDCRRTKFQNTYVGDSDFGLLVEDMRSHDAATSLLIDFKPKWLLQSPSAPKFATRCRQCAINLEALIQNPSSHSLPSTKVCPLALLQDDPWPTGSPFRIAPELENQPAFTDHFTKVLTIVKQHDAIQILKTQQALLDKTGPLNVSLSDADFAVAMTLRDCTCFALVPSHPDAASSVALQDRLKIRLGDLDWKDPAVKMERWRKAEKQLIDGGFYTATLIECAGVNYHVPTLCALELRRQSQTSVREVLKLFSPSDAPVDDKIQPSTDTAADKGYRHITNTAQLIPLLRASAEPAAQNVAVGA